MNLKLRLDKLSYFYFSCTSSAKSIIRTKSKGYLHFDKRIYGQDKEEKGRSQGKPKMMILEKVKGRRREYYYLRREREILQKINNEIERGRGEKYLESILCGDSYFVSLKIPKKVIWWIETVIRKYEKWIDKDKNMRISRKWK